jgi:hypothetical protein
MKSKEEILNELKGRYGFSKTDTKWLPEGFSIMEYIGIDLIVINFSRDPEKNEWVNTLSKGVILSLSEFDPITNTYLCKYTKDGMEEGSWKEVRIIPEGFELIGPDSNQMVRFVPYSLHSKMIETEEFYKKLFELQVKSKNLSINEIKTISESKDQGSILEYSHNIGAVIKTVDNEILWFRIKKLELNHLHSNIYNLVITTWDNKRFILREISSIDESYKFIAEHEEVGTLKIIDLAR